METGQRPRVVVSLSHRIGLPNYSHKDLFYSMSDDVQPYETPEEAFKRVEDLVVKKLKEMQNKLNK